MMEHRSVNQFAEIVYYELRAMPPKLPGVTLARDTDYKPEMPFGPGFDPRDGILDDNRPLGLGAKQLCRQQICVRGGFSGQVLGMNHMAVDLDVKGGIEVGCLKDRPAVFARGDDGDLEILDGASRE